MLLIHNLSLNNLHQMETAISLRYCPFPYTSKGFQGAGSGRFHLRFNHAAPLSAPQFSTTRYPVSRSVRHANCIFERFSQPSHNEGRGSKILRGVTGASLMLACVLGLFNFKMNPKLTTAHARFSYGDPNTSYFKHDEYKVEGQGRFAVKSLLETMTDSKAATIQNQEIPTKFDDRGPSGYDVKILKLIAIGQSQSEKGRKALKTLIDQYGECMNKNPEAEGYLAVALVEVYFFQNNLEDARKILEQQIDALLRTKKTEKCDELLKLYHSDECGHPKLWIAQLILHKAIVHTMLEDKEGSRWRKGSHEAAKWRKAFFQIF
ncbi:unnamed protein product [Sphenostylis stenocarpa]|uniref:Uncharacterized protein n=1 Tax=Sphenostylis stenocarpa TaxID=92480 RepID=A0AA86V629_9FABA|nr:unnamed protein product [Sphenostylis stenocarpa]